MPPRHPFFEEYMDTYVAGDAAAFSGFFHYPSLIVDSDGDHVISNDRDIEDYFRDLIAALQKSGLTEIEVEELSAQETHANDCFCSNRYKVYGPGKQLIGDMEYHYALTHVEAAWQIKFARLGALHYWA